MKEEQKQHLIDMMKADEELGLYNEETIIQAKYRLYKEYWNEDHTQLVKSNFLNGFEEGAKWQEERMYSEEDIRKAYFEGVKSTGEGWNAEYANYNCPNVEEVWKQEFKEWFEQFKKK